MAKQTIKRLTPTPKKLREIRALKVLGDWIYQPNLWHINRHSSATAFFVGLFCAFIPLPAQMIIAAWMAMVLRCNLPLSVGLCWTTNPITMSALFFMAYKVGAIALGITPEAIEFQLSWKWISESLIQIWQPFLLGCFLCGLLFGSLGYFTVSLLWRWEAMRRWKTRGARRRAKLNKTIHDVTLRQEETSQPDAPDIKPPGNTSGL